MYGKESLVPMQILKMFKQLDNELVIEHLKWHFKPTCPLSFDHLYSINDAMTVHCTKIHPIQFKFGKVDDMLTFYDEQGDGWTNICINKYWEICPKTVILLLLFLMDNHQTCSNPITSPKREKMVASNDITN